MRHRKLLIEAQVIYILVILFFGFPIVGKGDSFYDYLLFSFLTESKTAFVPLKDSILSIFERPRA
jgi:hypothetical protein